MKRLLVMGLFVAALLSIYAWTFAQFVPSQLAVRIGYVIGIAIALAGGVFAYQLKIKSNTASLKNNIWVRVISFAFLGLLIGFTAAATGFSSLYTISFGSRASREAMVTGWHYSHRGSCSGPNIAGASIMGTHLCSAQVIPSGTVIKLEGIETALGLEVSNIDAR